MSTPNMNLVELVPGVTAGPQYATDIVSNFSTIDSHDHTTGNGVRIPSAGLNINADLGFNGFGANALNRTQYNSLGAALTGAGNYRSVHVVNGELTFLDGSGNAVQITSSGSVAGASGNITGLSSPASVVFSNPNFSFFEETNQFARLLASEIRIHELSATSPNYVGISSPSSLAASYTLTMPGALPATDTYMRCSSSGAVTFFNLQAATDTVPGLLTYYQKENVTLNPAGGFIGGVITVERINDTVTITGNNLTTGGSPSSASTNIGALPSWARPAQPSVTNVYLIAPPVYYLMEVFTNGQIQWVAQHVTTGVGEPTAFWDSFSISYTIET